MINDYLIYVTLALTITLMPGPAVTLTIRNSLRYGYKVAIANIFGNFTAMVLLAVISAFGLGAVIIASSTLFSAVKMCGCIYLVYLGIRVWRTQPTQIDMQYQVPSKNKKVIASVFKEGFGVGISNPKAIVFFTALFPQFIDPSRAFIPQFLTLIITIEGISCCVLLGYALLSVVVAPYLSKDKSMKIFNKITGSAFIAFGIALIYET